MTNSEILRCFLWHIALYSYKPEDQPINKKLIGEVRKFIGLDIWSIREGIHFADVLALILLDVHRQIDECDWYGAEKNFRLFDRIALVKPIVVGLFFDRWLSASEYFMRKGFLDKALDATIQAEPFAKGHLLRYKLFYQRGKIECANKNRYEFAVNSFSLALYEAEQLGGLAVVKVYNQLAHMCGIHYAALGMSFLRKAQVLCKRMGDKNLIEENKLYRINGYYVLSLCHPQEAKLFLDEAQDVLNAVDYDSLPLLQNKMFYKKLQGEITHDVNPIIEACAYYHQVNSIYEICRCCDSIIEIGINYGQAAKALPYIGLYRNAALKQNRKDLQQMLQHIQEAEEIINGILGKQKE